MLNVQVCQEQFRDISKRYDSNYALIIEEINPIIFWIKNVDLPGLSIDTQEVPYEGIKLQNAGNNLNFDHVITPIFFVDEKLQVPNYFFNWIMGWKMGSSYEGKKQKHGAVVLFDNNSINVMGLYHFSNMYAESMSKINLRNKASVPLELTVTIKFDQWWPEIT